MSTRHPKTQPESDPQPNRTPTRTRPTTPETDPRTVTDRAPRTFSQGNTARLENLIDEFNAAFAGASGSAGGS